jgi:hypothetical protein
MGMCLVGALPYFRGLLLVISQILGGITAAAIVSALFPGPLTVRTKLGGGTSIVQGLFIEMFLTALLVFTIFMLAAEKHKGTFIAPIGIGLSLFVAELGGVYFTGGSVNPARSFGPNVVTHKFTGYHWIYWVGPILGSLLASTFYMFIKKLEYETANPGQDHASPEGEHFNPDLEKQEENTTDQVGSFSFDQSRYSNNMGEAQTASSSRSRAYSNTGSLSSQRPPGAQENIQEARASTLQRNSIMTATEGDQADLQPPSPPLKARVETPPLHPALRGTDHEGVNTARSPSKDSNNTFVERGLPLGAPKDTQQRRSSSVSEAPNSNKHHGQ